MQIIPVISTIKGTPSIDEALYDFTSGPCNVLDHRPPAETRTRDECVLYMRLPGVVIEPCGSDAPLSPASIRLAPLGFGEDGDRAPLSHLQGKE